MPTPIYDVKAGTSFPLTTDQEGGQLNLIPGRSSGLGRAVVSIKKGAVGPASSSTENELVNGFIIGGFKTLIDNTPVAFLSCTVANNRTSSGIINYCIEAFNGTDSQLETGIVVYQIINKGGTITTKLDNANTNIVTLRTTGTLAVSFSITSANPSIISINANTNLTPSGGFPRCNFSLFNLGNQEVTLL